MLQVKLIVTGDDFGYCPRRNQGIVDCFLAGAVSNVSLLVNGSAAADAAKLARRHNIPIGLHANLSEGSPVCQVLKTNSSLLNERGFFHGKMGFRTALSKGLLIMSEVKQELKAQVELFRELTGHLPPHMDGHQHVHVLPEVRHVFAEVLEEYGIKYTRVPIEPGLHNCDWIPPSLMDFYLGVEDDSFNTVDVFTRHGIRFLAGKSRGSPARSRATGGRGWLRPSPGRPLLRDPPPQEHREEAVGPSRDLLIYPPRHRPPARARTHLVSGGGRGDKLTKETRTTGKPRKEKSTVSSSHKLTTSSGFSICAKRYHTEPPRWPDIYIGLSTMGKNMSVSSIWSAIDTALVGFTTKAPSPAPPSRTVTIELMVHPGYPSVPPVGGCGEGPDDFSQSWERLHELQTLIKPELQSHYKTRNIQLCSFKDL